MNIILNYMLVSHSTRWPCSSKCITKIENPDRKNICVYYFLDKRIGKSPKKDDTLSSTLKPYVGRHPVEGWGEAGWILRRVAGAH